MSPRSTVAAAWPHVSRTRASARRLRMRAAHRWATRQLAQRPALADCARPHATDRSQARNDATLRAARAARAATLTARHAPPTTMRTSPQRHIATDTWTQTRAQTHMRTRSGRRAEASDTRHSPLTRHQHDSTYIRASHSPHSLSLSESSIMMALPACIFASISRRDWRPRLEKYPPQSVHGAPSDCAWWSIASTLCPS
jgi:hypothetical protein